MRRSSHATRPRLLWLRLALGLISVVALGVGVGLGVAYAAPPVETSASATAAASSGALARELRIRDRVVFMFRTPRAGRSAEERARAANGALEALLAHPEELGEARFEETQGTAVVYVGKAPITTLGPEDVEATGDASVAVLAAQLTARLDAAAASERKRSAIATTVFSFSLLVFSGLLVFLLLQRLGEMAARVRSAVVDDPERLHAVRLGKIEFVSAGAARGVTSIALTLGHRLLQAAIAYGWLIFALSLFDVTRAYTQRLTGLVVTPLSGLAQRVGSALPLLVVAGLAAFAVTVLVRFLGLFFDSVARGDTRASWLPRDLARPTSVLVRAGVVVISFVVASPLITGSDDGVLSRAGLVALLAVALACTPLLASIAVGVSVVYSRRLRKGEHVQIGGREGRLVEASLLDVRLEDVSGCEIRVPHLLALVHPTRVHGHAPLASVEVTTAPGADPAVAEAALLAAARELASRGRVELLALDEGGARWRVTSASRGPGDRSLGLAIAHALASAGVGLGGPRRSPEVP
jgi:small-conductance mechanosensitive channel